MTELTEISEEEAIKKPIAKIGSFWLSQIGFSDLRVFTKNAVMGNVNPRWTAPEILRGLPYSEKSDVYALGLLLWELKYRKLVFQSEESGEAFSSNILHQSILNGHRPPIDLSDEYDQLCSRCWTENPNIRPTAQAVVQELFKMTLKYAPTLAKSLAPSIGIWEDPLPPSDASCSSSPFPSFRWGETFKVEETRLTCSTMAGSILWFGGRNGKIGVFNIEGKEFLFVDDDLLETKALLQSICYMPTSSTVWSGSNSGDIIVWNAAPLNGKMAAEKLRWSGEVSKGFFRRSGMMTLAFGSITMEGALLSDSIPVRDILSVQSINSTSFSVTTKSETQKYSSSESDGAVQYLKRCMSYYTRKSVLFKRTDHRISFNDGKNHVIPVISLIEVDGKGWSLDGRLHITEWNLEESQQDVWSLVPFRVLFDLNSIVYLGQGVVLFPVGIWRVHETEWWVGLGDQFVRFEKTPSKGEEMLQYRVKGALKNQWMDLPDSVRPKDLEILCAGVVEVSLTGQLEKEVWVSTLLGTIFVWNVKTGRVRRVFSINKMVSTMMVLNDEVGCHLFLEFSFHFFHFNFPLFC